MDLKDINKELELVRENKRKAQALVMQIIGQEAMLEEFKKREIEKAKKPAPEKPEPPKE